ncbi:hypothetical protein FJY93_04645 [Candidatus Kaiserbacteria bacterium]|nr:hypothetical protein [Candidatus Kaiserbacteria bacterium]
MQKILFLDTETTGNEPDTDRLCQVCWMEGGTYHTEYFKPPIPISVKSMSITHITNKMVANKPAFADSEFRRELEEALADHILVAHNARFDMAMLAAEGVEVPRHICTLRVARYLDPESKIPEYGLQFLRYFLDLDVSGSAAAGEYATALGFSKAGVPAKKISAAACEDATPLGFSEAGVPAKKISAAAGEYATALGFSKAGVPAKKISAHDAEGDVRVLAALFERLFKKMQESGEYKTDDEILDAMCRISETPSFIAVFQFGKYKGVRVADVAKTDRGYLQWLLQQKLADGGQDEDWIFTLKTYVG